ncbi:MAG: sigma 54-interacting transcriptional regulator [Desulfobacterales bacterium]|jgi:PAS domain S-box-containing protein
MGEHLTIADIEKPLTQADGFFRKLLDSMQVGVIVSDHEGTIIYLNETYARFLNIDPKSQIGKHATEVVANSRLHIVAKTGKAEINYTHQFKDTAFLVHRVPIKENGKVIAVLGLVLFDSASTASRLSQKLSYLESKLDLYENELVSLRSTRYTFESIIGNSETMAALKKEALKASGNQLPVLLSGESGTGKELFAQAIHHASSRKLYPFVRINCAAIPRDLLESELFGYEKGAFTGAKTDGKPGKFELAHCGTIFLDEVGDLPLEMQPKLLRAIEEKEFERIGGTRMIRSDFRLIAATNQHLEKMVETGRFRKDLFYRLNVISLNIPPLRKRRNDILPLTQHFLKQISQEAALADIKIDTKAQEALISYHWPGNAREISNVLERTLSSIEGDTIHLYDLPFYLKRFRSNPIENYQASLKEVQHRAEKEAIKLALKKTGNNKAQAAKILGINRTLLYKKMAKHHIALQPD